MKLFITSGPGLPYSSSKSFTSKSRAHVALSGEATLSFDFLPPFSMGVIPRYYMRLVKGINRVISVKYSKIDTCSYFPIDHRQIIDKNLPILEAAIMKPRYMLILSYLPSYA